MKYSILAAASGLLAMPALAADLPRRTTAPPPEPLLAATPVSSWAGFYAGGQIGYGWTKSDYVVATPAAGSFGLSPDGVRGGLHAGYNWHRGPLVYGVEADMELASASERLARTLPSLPPVTRTFGSRVGAHGSLRLRLGYGFDRALLYATGGVAVARIRESAAGPGAITSVSGPEYGYTLGAGVEYAFTDNLSARVEYRYTDFGKSRFASLTPAVTTRIDTTDSAVRLGLSYRFGGWAGPILARY